MAQMVFDAMFNILYKLLIIPYTPFKFQKALKSNDLIDRKKQFEQLSNK